MKINKVILLFILCILLCSCSHEQTEDIYILYTNDVASAIDENFGYAGVKGYKDYLETDHKYVALVDAGDYFDGRIATSDNGHNITSLMNAVGYDVVTLGNQEFSIGLDNLAENIKEADYDTVSCNIKYIGDGSNPIKAVKPYVIKKFGRVRIAFIGVTTPETTTERKQAYEAITKDGVLQYDFYGGNDGEDLYEQIQSTVDKARKKAEYVILIAHLGANSVTEGWSSYDVIRNTYGIDVVIDGHSHSVISGEPVLNKTGDLVALTSTGKEFENLGELVLHPDHTVTTTLYPSVYERDAEVQALVDAVLEEYGD